MFRVGARHSEKVFWKSCPEMAWKGDLKGVLKRTWLGAGIPGSSGTEGQGSVKQHNWECVWLDMATGIEEGERKRRRSVRTDDMM